MSQNPKIAIIGAGPSGITALKNLATNGFDVTCFEMSNQIGGNWVYKDQTGHSSIFKTTHIISSKKFSEYIDFPMPDDYPDYPSGAELLAYFNSYVDHFELEKHIRFNTKVHKAIPIDNKWKIFFEDSSEDFDYLVVANGHHWSPRIPNFDGNFSGELMHSHQFKNNEYFKDKSVLVVGGGNSACDIAVEVSRVAKKTSISMRRGYHFIPKFIMGMPSDAYYAKTLWIPQKVRLFLQKLALRIIQGKYEDYGLQKPDHDILQSHATVNSELLYFIKHGKISPKMNIGSFQENTVEFENGIKEDYDIVLFATGYKISFPFFSNNHIDYENNDIDLYNFCFHPSFKNLMFVGLLQPLGCIWPLSDLQSQQIVKYLKKEWSLPTDFAKAVSNQLNSMPYDFIDTPRHKLEVDFHDFANHLKREIS
tara:strand:- start:1241 stop:2506 length:1266 start_codon:yes stop_codon:yes gene_type:complete